MEELRARQNQGSLIQSRGLVKMAKYLLQILLIVGLGTAGALAIAVYEIVRLGRRKAVKPN
jgi:hypothetical protein